MSRGFFLTWLLILAFTQSFAWLVSRVVRLFYTPQQTNQLRDRQATPPRRSQGTPAGYSYKIAKNQKVANTQGTIGRRKLRLPASIQDKEASAEQRAHRL